MNMQLPIYTVFLYRNITSEKKAIVSDWESNPGLPIASQALCYVYAIWKFRSKCLTFLFLIDRVESWLHIFLFVFVPFDNYQVYADVPKIMFLCLTRSTTSDNMRLKSIHSIHSPLIHKQWTLPMWHIFHFQCPYSSLDHGFTEFCILWIQFIYISRWPLVSEIKRTDLLP